MRATISWSLFVVDLTLYERVTGATPSGSILFQDMPLDQVFNITTGCVL